MVKVICPMIECKNYSNKCGCQAKQINMTCRAMTTRNNDRLNVWICNTYEMSDEAKRVHEIVDRFMEGKNDICD